MNSVTHKLVYCAFMECALSAFSVGINTSELNTKYETNFTISYGRLSEIRASDFQSLFQARPETFCNFIFYLHSNLKLLCQIHITHAPPNI